MYFTWIDEDARISGSVVAIGNFDGVHRGHQAVLARVREDADRLGVASVVLTFDPHPARVLGRTPPPMLTSLERKASLVTGSGVARVMVQRFDEAFSRSSPEGFATVLLSQTLGAREVVVGDNFRFGHKRQGDLAALEALGTKLGFTVRVFDAVGDADGPFSSTRAREAVRGGDMERAAHVLGRPHSFSGVVEKGAQRGRTLGFPTANVGQVVEMLPAHGVYAVRAEIEGESRARGGVMNLGRRPTVDGTTPSQEVHLFDFEGDLYGKAMRVEVLSRIREERKFDGLLALKAQIASDAEEARRRLA